MIRLILITVFALFCNIIYSQKNVTIYSELGEWKRTLRDSNNVINIKSYVIRKDNIYDKNDSIRIKVSTLPKYRYEIILHNESKSNKKTSTINIDGIKIYINNIEVTRNQYPDGFFMIIDNNPTTIYWYDSNNDNIKITLSWSKISLK